MPNNKESNPKQLTEENVDDLVAVVQAAEIIAEEMKIKVSEAVRLMIRSAQLTDKFRIGKVFNTGAIISKGKH